MQACAPSRPAVLFRILPLVRRRAGGLRPLQGAADPFDHCFFPASGFLGAPALAFFGRGGGLNPSLNPSTFGERYMAGSDFEFDCTPGLRVRGTRPCKGRQGWANLGYTHQNKAVASELSPAELAPAGILSKS